LSLQAASWFGECVPLKILNECSLFQKKVREIVSSTFNFFRELVPD
jgi:hypothetical protein